ncbi:hypothetical protein EMCRGX_G022697 [Ephydatia muelleri]
MHAVASVVHAGKLTLSDKLETNELPMISLVGSYSLATSTKCKARPPNRIHSHRVVYDDVTGNVTTQSELIEGIEICSRLRRADRMLVGTVNDTLETYNENCQIIRIDPSFVFFMPLALMLMFLAASNSGLSLGEPLPACSGFFTPTPRRAKDTSAASLTCHHADGSNILFPKPNHRVCYRTCVRTYQNGTEVCETLSSAEASVEPLPITQPSDPALAGMYFTTRLASPGFFTEKRYRNNVICRYHVQCDPGQLLHFLIPSFSIEEPFRTTCLDSLTIDRSLYGAKKTICGGLSSIDSDREDFNDGRLYVEFSTNRVINDDGFYIAVTCVRPQFYNIPPPESVAAGEEEAQQRDRRGTRNSIEDLTPSSAIFRVRHKRTFRVVSITIPSGSSILYHQNTVRVYKSNQWLYRFHGIEVFQVYNKAEGYLAFYGSAGARNFPGLAEMLIGVGVVHLIQKGVNPAFRLTLSDEDALQLMYQELYRQGVFMNEDFDIDPSVESSIPETRSSSSKQMVVKPPAFDSLPEVMPPLPPNATPSCKVTPPLPPNATPSCKVTPPLPPNATPSSAKNIDFRELALMYSISENGVVRAAACLYLNKVLNRTCVWHEQNRQMLLS